MTIVTHLKITPLLWLMTILVMAGSAGAQDTVTAPAAEAQDTLLPASDSANSGGWVLNEDISDEFEGDTIDHKKWFIQGENGGEYYIWKGRPPSQFAEHNVLQEDGMLKIRTQWEPEFEFVNENYADGDNNDAYGVFEGKPMPVTTGGIISRRRFLNGYMEVRTKAGNACMTSSFWAIGYESELDIYEQIGNPNIKGGDIQEDTWKASIHDWSPPAKRPTRRFGLKKKLPFRVADEFHVYGCEWGEDYLKLFLDGELVYETTQEKEGKNWVLNNPLEIWFDSEIFKWLGVPKKEEFPVDYEIDYVRIWQQPHVNLLPRQLFSFEGPLLFDETVKIPLDLVPESSEVNEYQKFWEIGEHALTRFSFVKDQAAKGNKSLKFEPGDMLGNVSVVSPASSVNVPAGEYYLSLKVFLEADCGVQKINVSLSDPEIILEPLDLSEVEQGKWVTLSQPIKRDAASGEHDRLRLRFLKKEVEPGTGSMFIDDICLSINPVAETKVPESAPESTLDSAPESTPPPTTDSTPPTTAKASTDKTKEEWVAIEKAKWEKNGWKWNQAMVESNFDEMDTNQDGIASGIERKLWFESKAKK